MERFEIYTDTFESRFGKYKGSIPTMSGSDIWMEYNCQSCNDPLRVASFENLDDALAFFRENYDDYGRTWAEKGNVWWLLRGQVAWIDRNEYDEDGNFVDGGDLYECSAEAYEKEDA